MKMRRKAEQILGLFRYQFVKEAVAWLDNQVVAVDRHKGFTSSRRSKHQDKGTIGMLDTNTY
jgi:hypothetical protein